MAEKDEEQPTRSFKVADRRRFVDNDSTDAERDRDDRARDDQRAADLGAAPTAGAATHGGASSTATADYHHGHEHHGREHHDHEHHDHEHHGHEHHGHEHHDHEHGLPPEMTFSTFVIGLTTQALMHLGEIADPTQPQMAADLPAAKQMIDLLGILREKTKGNLDDAETQLLDSMLYDLRIRYVEVSRGR